ncbi:DUF5615 family PIN-like protein [Deinococcus frigens]|uniref:DUF5615 family PIN-like protein n=1 Tax=Deinococcus frigens TaxID=249403 RepID=UPI00068E0A56|nr:DUF5615 family PIN-like protein [Deinococcus frigens]
MIPAGVLLDENVSARLRGAFDLPVVHVTDWQGGLKDWALWERATQDALVIVTQDADFTERMLAQQPPPWVVHVRTGNMRVADFRALIDLVWPRVWELLEGHKLVVIYRDRLEAVRGETA